MEQGGKGQGAGRKEKVTASGIAKFLNGLRGLYNLNRGQSHIKFPLK